MEALRRTLFSVCGQLERDGRGARLVGVVFDQAGGSTTETSIGLARPSTNHTAMLRQFEPFLGRFDVGFGIDRLRVVALRHEPAHMRQLSVGEETVREAAFEELVGRLGNRLGFDRVTRPLPLDSHLAGQDVALVPAVAPAPPRSSSSPSRHEWTRQPSSDPLRLIPPVPLAPLGEGRPPRRFQWRGGVAEVTSVRGPRRLTGEWWHTNAARRGFRDYWDVETRTGGRLWLRCDVSPDGTRHWSVAGSLP